MWSSMGNITIFVIHTFEYRSSILPHSLVLETEGPEMTLDLFWHVIHTSSHSVGLMLSKYIQTITCIVNNMRL